MTTTGDGAVGISDALDVGKTPWRQTMQAYKTRIASLKSMRSGDRSQ